MDYHGVGATLSVWNNPAQAPQYTVGRIKLRNGDESMEVGWTVVAQKFLFIYTHTCFVYLTNVSYIIFVHFVFQVNPGLYGDTRTHLYIYTNVISLF